MTGIQKQSGWHDITGCGSYSRGAPRDEVILANCFCHPTSIPGTTIRIVAGGKAPLRSGLSEVFGYGCFLHDAGLGRYLFHDGRITTRIVGKNVQGAQSGAPFQWLFSR